MIQVRSAPARRAWFALLRVAFVPALVLAACSTAGTATPGSSAPATASPATSPTSGSGSGSGGPTPPVALTVGLGYIPSVQFAQFYLAQQAGYYRDAGLEVTFQNKIDPDLVKLVGLGTVDVGLGDGTSVIPAASQGIPVKYVATVYAQNPNIVLAKASSGITTAADLKGKKLGIPGKYGSSWIMLQALLASVNLTPDDLQIVLYPDFGQAAALQQGAVDAATGFANNEPIQLEAAGQKLVILSLGSATPLPGPGLITGASTLAAKSGALEAFVAATLKAMKTIEADPQQGLDGGDRRGPGARPGPGRPAGDPEGDRRDVVEPLHRGPRHRRDRPGCMDVVHRLHGFDRPGSQSGDGRPARHERASAGTLTREPSAGAAATATERCQLVEHGPEARVEGPVDLEEPVVGGRGGRSWGDPAGLAAHSSHGLLQAVDETGSGRCQHRRTEDAGLRDSRDPDTDADDVALDLGPRPVRRRTSGQPELRHLDPRVANRCGHVTNGEGRRFQHRPDEMAAPVREAQPDEGPPRRVVPDRRPLAREIRQEHQAVRSGRSGVRLGDQVVDRPLPAEDIVGQPVE